MRDMAWLVNLLKVDGCGDGIRFMDFAEMACGFGNQEQV